MPRRPDVIIPGSTRMRALYRSADAVFADACEAAGIPTGVPLPAVAGDLLGCAFPVDRGVEQARTLITAAQGRKAA